ncbi:RNase adapter RapZ [Neoactinobaculum massilliense]|uniref:RNase adapter RapZ n=1 Tax=Neoactinobaculum massilliense TaxID=2364794 RepID=UPI000F535899|nr:RNase adapter RapZ [Neoactinobaculum massilliense]
MSETRRYDPSATANIPAVVAKDEAATPIVPNVPEVLIVTGMSGAGRSRTAATLEDLGWYVVDNIPPRLIRALAGLITPDGGVNRLAVVVDVRGREFFAELVDALHELKTGGIAYRIIFLDASDEELVRRYESVRRPHPLQGDGRLLDGIVKERAILADLARRADYVINTTGLSVHDLARKVRTLVGEDAAAPRVTVTSFGFKYGIPLDADNVADVRFLPNPYWVTELRHLNGNDAPVADYVLAQPGAREFVEQYGHLMDSVLAGYQREMKPFTSIVIGCTGGQHRSVAIANAISEYLRSRGHNVRTIHRDLGRE